MSKIIVIDDEPSTRSVVLNILENLGHTVVGAANGRDALRQLQKDPQITTMLTDLLMPDMDGLELIMAARRLRPDLRIVAMSAGGTRVTLDLLPVALSLGADATFQKPFSHDKIALVTGADPCASATPDRSGAAAGAAEHAELGAVPMVEPHRS